MACGPGSLNILAISEPNNDGNASMAASFLADPWASRCSNNGIRITILLFSAQPADIMFSSLLLFFVHLPICLLESYKKTRTAYIKHGESDNFIIIYTNYEGVQYHNIPGEISGHAESFYWLCSTLMPSPLYNRTCTFGRYVLIFRFLCHLASPLPLQLSRIS